MQCCAHRRQALAAAATTLMLQSAVAHAGALRIEEVQDRLIHCFQQDQYYVSGKLDAGIFADDCLFTDPTVRTRGVQYARYDALC